MKYGDVRCVAGGQALTVRYGNLAWDELQRQLAATSKVGVLLKARESGDAFLDFVAAGLAAYHPELTLAQVRDLYDEIREPGAEGLSLTEAVWEAVKLALPELTADAEKGDGDGPKAPARRRRSTKAH